MYKNRNVSINFLRFVFLEQKFDLVSRKPSKMNLTHTVTFNKI